MKKLYQRGWFDIKFDQLGVAISEKNIAGVGFYTAFYREFYKRFESYDDLPEYWIKLKDEIIDHLSGLVRDDQQILSIGCGNGYIEYKLSQTENMAPYYTSMCLDQLAGRPLEIEAILGEVVRFSQLKRVAVPVILKLYQYFI